MQHRTRDLLMRQCTQLINALRAHLAELGVAAAQGCWRWLGVDLHQWMAACRKQTYKFTVIASRTTFHFGLMTRELPHSTDGAPGAVRFYAHHHHSCFRAGDL